MARPGPNPTRVPQTAHDLEIRKPDGRQETGRKCGERGDTRGEEQRGRVDSDGTQSWDAFRSRSDHQRDTDPREQDAARASERRQQQGLGHLRTNQGHARGAERATHGHVPPPALCPGDQQVRHVRARDEQHDPDSAHQNPERFLDVSDQRFLQRTHDRTMLFDDPRIAG